MFTIYNLDMTTSTKVQGLGTQTAWALTTSSSIEYECHEPDWTTGIIVAPSVLRYLEDSAPTRKGWECHLGSEIEGRAILAVCESSSLTKEYLLDLSWHVNTVTTTESIQWTLNDGSEMSMVYYT